MLLPVWIAITGLISGCDNTVHPGIDIIQIEGVSWACNVNTSYAVFGSSSESEEHLEITIPASEGDLLYMLYDDLELYYRYNAQNGTQYSVSFDTLGAVSAYLNGRLSYMELSGPESFEVFQQLTETEITQLYALLISDALTDDLMSILKQHETSLQGKGLILEGSHETGKLNDLLTLVRPRFLVIDNFWHLPDPEENISLSSLELLWIDGNIPLLAKLARCCNNLQSLIVAEWEPEEGELLPLSGLDKLQSLTIAESDLTTLSSVEFPESLQNLYLISCDTLSDISKLRKIQNLSRLSLTQCERIQGLDVLQELDLLQGVSFPPGISHKEFQELTDAMKLLEIVEIIDCPNIQDLSPLQGLPDLKILLLQLEINQLNMLDSLDQVELVGLTSEVFEDNPEWIRELRISLPNTTIVPGSGICLGSGWLLLLLPFILIFRYFFRKRT